MYIYLHAYIGFILQLYYLRCLNSGHINVKQHSYVD